MTSCRFRATASRFSVGLAIALMLAAVPGSAGTKPGSGRPAKAADEFFIVSSVDSAHHAMVLKRPTEVTLTMRVSETTRCASEDGRPLSISDLRAGDTVFITSSRDASGALVASDIRQGVMTIGELRRRYFRQGP